MVAYEYVDARSPGAIDFDSVDVDGSVVLKGEGFDNNGTFAEPQRKWTIRVRLYRLNTPYL